MVTFQSVHRAILVQPTLFNFLTFVHSGAQDRAPECTNFKKLERVGWTMAQWR